MARKKRAPTPLELAASRALHDLFQRMADEWAGEAEMTDEGPSWIRVRLAAPARAEPAECKLTMCYNSSGIALVCVQGRGADVYVSEVPSAVIAVMTR